MRASIGQVIPSAKDGLFKAVVLWGVPAPAGKRAAGRLFDSLAGRDPAPVARSQADV